MEVREIPRFFPSQDRGHRDRFPLIRRDRLHNTGRSYVCKDGPVYTLAELEKLPAEY